jgi:hypothetical protein
MGRIIPYIMEKKSCSKPKFFGQLFQVCPWNMVISSSLSLKLDIEREELQHASTESQDSKHTPSDLMLIIQIIQ